METGVSYFSSRDPRHVRTDLIDMLAHHCTYVVHALTESDLAFSMEGMGEIVRLTRDAGLDCWFEPWGAAGLFPGELFSRFLLEHPESWQLRSDGRNVPAACPNDPEARRFLRAWVQRAAELGASVVLWNDPRLWVDSLGLEEGWTCLCPLCRDAFVDRFHAAMPLYVTEEVRRFREESLLGLLTDLCGWAHRAGLRNALCLTPSDLAASGFPELEARELERINRGRRHQDAPPLEMLPPSVRFAGIADWGSAAALPSLDFIGCTLGRPAFETAAEPFVVGIGERLIRAARQAGERARRRVSTQIWLESAGFASGREGDLWTAVRTTARLGVSHVALRSYGGGTGLDLGRAERPEVVWRVTGDAYRAVARR